MILLDYSLTSQVHSYRNQVQFTEATKRLPGHAVVIEIGPHAILRSAFRQNRPELPYIPLMRKGDCGLATVGQAVSEMWRKGIPMQWPEGTCAAKSKDNEGSSDDKLTITGARCIS